MFLDAGLPRNSSNQQNHTLVQLVVQIVNIVDRVSILAICLTSFLQNVFEDGRKLTNLMYKEMHELQIVTTVPTFSLLNAYWVTEVTV